MTGPPPPGSGPPRVQFEVPLTPTVSVSFQRTPCPAGGVLAELPRSWGALPAVLDGPEDLAVPVPDGEAVWIGLLSESGAPVQSVSVVAVLAPGGPTDAVTGRPVGGQPPGTVTLPPTTAVIGVLREGGGWWALTRVGPGNGAPACSRVDLRTPTDRLVAHLVPPSATTARAGVEVPPLDPAAPYGGWRLP